MKKLFAAGAVLLAVSACTSAPVPAEPALSAHLDTPLDVTVRWSTAGPAPDGRVLEYAHDPNGEWTVLKFLAPEDNTFKHDSLIPETRFYYRVRPYFGRPSAEVTVTMPEPKPGEKPDEDPHEWAVPQTLPGGPAATRSLRADAAAAAPTDFTGVPMTSQGIRFTWTDNAGDEQHHAIEVRSRTGQPWHTAALLDANVNSFGVETLPEERAATYRVRAFYYGEASTVVTVLTGKEPKGG
ncbi:hypothetical protein JOF53_006874 [Crossiella equi]|uniref:Fibronectin type-III domain-containing protein n=1 Tax=Crossiella equi TaxID=130796 RepID=A0ABS5ANN3_9PSEU|nr:fibronectin type III domain-containing protein [Crossiella equi]MBP2478002.1 hypothetical protein [Crossiella equi]